MESIKLFTSGYLIFIFLLLTFGLFIGLYLIRKFIPIIFSGKYNINQFRKYFSMLELIAWLFFLLMGIIYFSKHNIVFSGIQLLLLLLLLFWYARFTFRDYLAGLIFKIENKFTLGEIIETDNRKGQITHFYSRALEIKTENGKKVLIPYHKLLDVVGSTQNVSESVLNYSFEISLKTDKSLEEVVELLKTYILSLPWFVTKYSPKIQLINFINNSNSYMIKITLYSFEKKYFHTMQKRIETFIENDFFD